MLRDAKPRPRLYVNGRRVPYAVLEIGYPRPAYDVMVPGTSLTALSDLGPTVVTYTRRHRWRVYRSVSLVADRIEAEVLDARGSVVAYRVTASYLDGTLDLVVGRPGQAYPEVPPEVRALLGA